MPIPPSRCLLVSSAVPVLFTSTAITTVLPFFAPRRTSLWMVSFSFATFFFVDRLPSLSPKSTLPRPFPSPWSSTGVPGRGFPTSAPSLQATLSFMRRLLFLEADIPSRSVGIFSHPSFYSQNMTMPRLKSTSFAQLLVFPLKTPITILPWPMKPQIPRRPVHPTSVARPPPDTNPHTKTRTLRSPRRRLKKVLPSCLLRL